MSYKLIDKYGSIRWFNGNREYHREDGPAIEYSNGEKRWYLNGKLHREDGPAIVCGEYNEWYLNGKLHREGGPAIEYSIGSKEWWIDDIKYSEKEYKIKMRSKKLKDIL